MARDDEKQPAYSGMKARFSGFATEDPRDISRDEDKSVAAWKCAVNFRDNREKEGVFWLDIVTFGDTAKNILESGAKGDSIMGDGDLMFETYETKDGDTGISFKMAPREIGGSFRSRTLTQDRPDRPSDSGGRSRGGRRNDSDDRDNGGGRRSRRDSGDSRGNDDDRGGRRSRRDSGSDDSGSDSGRGGRRSSRSSRVESHGDGDDDGWKD